MKRTVKETARSAWAALNTPEGTALVEWVGVAGSAGLLCTWALPGAGLTEGTALAAGVLALALAGSASLVAKTVVAALSLAARARVYLKK